MRALCKRTIVQGRTTAVKMTHKYKTTGNALYNTYNMLRELE